MALQFIDSFDHYYLSNDVGFTGGQAATAQKWDSNVLAGEMYPQIGSGRFGGMAMRVKASSGAASITKNVITPVDEMIVGFAYNAGASPQDALIVFDDDATSAVQTTLTMIMSTGNLSVTNNMATVNEVTAAPVLTQGVWAYIEFRLKVHATAGEVEVKVNGVVVITATSLNTGATGGLLENLSIASTSNLQLDHVDDLYLLDTTGATNNTFLGDSRIQVLVPVADGNTNNFSLTSDDITHLANWQTQPDDVDITLGRDHNYVESGLIGASEDYDNKSMFNAGVVAINNIYGIQVVNNSRKTATGVLRFKNEMVIAGTVFDNGTEVVASTGDYHMSTFIRDTDPSDSATWTEAKVDAVGSGYSITFREI